MRERYVKRVAVTAANTDVTSVTSRSLSIDANGEM
jgi:hypothetical protein